MAEFSLKLPQIDTDTLTDKQAVKKLQSYLVQLHEQLRYMMMNLDGDNIAQGSIGEEQLSIGLKNNIYEINVNQLRMDSRIQEADERINNRIADAEGNISILGQTTTAIATQVSNAQGDISILYQTATAITTRVSDAEGNISTLQQTATSLTTRVSNAEGDISTLTQTASGLTSRVSSAEGDISTLQQTATSISARVSSIENDGTGKVNNTAVLIDGNGVEIKSTGRLKVNMANFKIDSSGNVTVTGQIDATSGYIGNYVIINQGMRSLTSEVTLLQDEIGVGPVGNRGFRATGSGAYIKALYLYDSGTGSYRDVTAAILALL